MHRIFRCVVDEATPGSEDQGCKWTGPLILYWNHMISHGCKIDTITKTTVSGLHEAVLVRFHKGHSLIACGEYRFIIVRVNEMYSLTVVSMGNDLSSINVRMDVVPRAQGSVIKCQAHWTTLLDFQNLGSKSWMFGFSNAWRADRNPYCNMLYVKCQTGNPFTSKRDRDLTKESDEKKNEKDEDQPPSKIPRLSDSTDKATVKR
jgi:hypothetical protein